MLTVTVDADPQAVLEELLELDLAGSTLTLPLQLPHAVEELLEELEVLVGSALQVPQVVLEELEVLAGSALHVPQVVVVVLLLELEVLAGSALHVPQVVVLLLLLEELEVLVGSALQVSQVPVPVETLAVLELGELELLKPADLEKQVELVQVPKPLPKV